MKRKTIIKTICAVLLLSNRWCLAQDGQDPCPNNGKVIPVNEETLDYKYQPYPSPSPAILQRFRFVPPNALPAQKFPTVLMLPPDVFRYEYEDFGVPTEKQASYDLQQAGFLVFQVDHRLAPPGMLEHQMTSDKGYAPEQTDDLKRQILAALADPLCNGNIYLVGGSAGGTLVLWCALDPASTVSGWDEMHARSHIKAVVSFSGPTDFCDYDSNPGNIPPTALASFQNDLDNYVGLPPQISCDPQADPTQKLNHASPEWLVANGATSSPPPIRLYATDGDPVPNSQGTDMFQALKTQYGNNFDVVLWIMHYPYGDSHSHAYNYWHALNNAMGSDDECVSQEVISFLQAH